MLPRPFNHSIAHRIDVYNHQQENRDRKVKVRDFVRASLASLIGIIQAAPQDWLAREKIRSQFNQEIIALRKYAAVHAISTVPLDSLWATISKPPTEPEPPGGLSYLSLLLPSASQAHPGITTQAREPAAPRNYGALSHQNPPGSHVIDMPQEVEAHYADDEMSRLIDDYEKILQQLKKFQNLFLDKTIFEFERPMHKALLYQYITTTHCLLKLADIQDNRWLANNLQHVFHHLKLLLPSINEFNLDDIYLWLFPEGITYPRVPESRENMAVPIDVRVRERRTNLVVDMVAVPFIYPWVEGKRFERITARQVSALQELCKNVIFPYNTKLLASIEVYEKQNPNLDAERAKYQLPMKSQRVGLIAAAKTAVDKLRINFKAAPTTNASPIKFSEFQGDPDDKKLLEEIRAMAEEVEQAEAETETKLHTSKQLPGPAVSAFSVSLSI